MEHEIESSIFPVRQFVYASFLQRTGAKAVDFIVLIIINTVVELVVGIIFEMSAIVMCIQVLVVTWLYNALMESGSGQATIGKGAVGIKVADMAGYQVTFREATIRSWCKYISLLIVLVGFLMVLWDPKRQALHDRIAGTLVIAE
jgi:uncharacterized RDD family membrane protein YckC